MLFSRPHRHSHESFDAHYASRNIADLRLKDYLPLFSTLRDDVDKEFYNVIFSFGLYGELLGASKNSDFHVRARKSRTERRGV